jgi:alanyl-tRNA synthetase
MDNTQMFALKTIKEISSIFNNPADIKAAVAELQSKYSATVKQIESFEKDHAANVKKELLNQIESLNGINFLARQLDIQNSAILKDIAFQLKGEVENLFLVLAAAIDGKANIHVMISDNLVSERKLNAGAIIRELAKKVGGSGGGQPFYATAGGKEPAGIPELLKEARELIK